MAHQEKYHEVVVYNDSYGPKTYKYCLGRHKIKILGLGEFPRSAFLNSPGGLSDSALSILIRKYCPFQKMVPDWDNDDNVVALDVEPEAPASETSKSNFRHLIGRKVMAVTSEVPERVSLLLDDDTEIIIAAIESLDDGFPTLLCRQ